ncbi:MAG: ABC transporter ATP-binding protein [Parasporobacterium sp.]|nr:ABC transporter ATP-binding protein [Parasporobacterium sp.]
MLRLIRFLKARDYLYLITLLVFVVVSVWCTLTLPDYMTKITQLVQTPTETGVDMGEVWKCGGIMLAFALGDLACTFIVGYCTSMVAASLSKNLRKAVYDKVVGFSMEEINSFSTSSLVTRSTNDIVQIVMLVTMGLQMILRAPIVAIWAVFKIIGKGWQWTLITAGAVAVVILTILVVLMLATPKFKLIQKLTDRLNLVTRENLTGVRVVRAYNAEHYQEEKFDDANIAITKNHLFTGRTMSFLMPTMQLTMSMTSLLVYWIGASIINNTADIMDKINVFSNLVTFMAYAMQIIMAFMMVSMIFMLLPRAQVSAGRILEVLDMKTKIVDGDGNVPAHGSGTVEFRNVSFRYPDAQETVLENITFTAKPGETVAFIGSTGSGKSTLINLVPRFFDVSSGEVLVDGADVKHYALDDLRKKIGYVSQKAILFKGTLASNINYGVGNNHNVTDEDIVHALTVAQGRDIIDKNEKGLQTEVAQGGSNFSGGQKQRISIARAICKKPEIFIFDDSFSALDYKTDKVLRSELKKETAGATILIVAQRIGTVKDADKIIVLDEGRMVGMGRHRELLKDCEVYRQIAYSQLSKEELENA